MDYRKRQALEFAAMLDAPDEWGYRRQRQYVDVDKAEQNRLKWQQKAEVRRRKKNQQPV